MLFATLLALSACREEPARSGPGEDFSFDDSVRFLSPVNGETVEPTFTVQFEIGDAVKGVSLEADGAVLTDPTPADDLDRSLVVTLEEGRHTLALIGLDKGGDELSRHEVLVRVAEPSTSWITIVSPSDGADLPNPVTFVVDASSDVDEVELLADDWSIGAVEPGGSLTYTFNGTGYERVIDAVAVVDGVEVKDSITLTVEPATQPADSAFNAVVVDYLESYPTDGTHGYYWPSGSSWLGTTRDIWYQGQLVAQGDPEGRCYCVGLTWELFMRSWDDVDRSTGGDGSINGIDVEELTEFRVDWYVRDLYGAGVVDALENYGIGERVTDFDDVQYGDFVQFWRNSGSGHNVMFVDWEYDGSGNVIGMYYWGTQGSTDGIGYNSEYFGTGGSSIDPEFFFVGRVLMPEDWVPWY